MHLIDLLGPLTRALSPSHTHLLLKLCLYFQHVLICQEDAPELICLNVLSAVIMHSVLACQWTITKAKLISGNVISGAISWPMAKIWQSQTVLKSNCYEQ